MSERYGIGAMEMTTAELFDDLKDTEVSKELASELRDLFDRADFVKFAKFTASDEDNAAALPVAVRFVTETYQADVESETPVMPSEVETSPKRVLSQYLPSTLPDHRTVIYEECTVRSKTGCIFGKSVL